MSCTHTPLPNAHCYTCSGGNPMQDHQDRWARAILSINLPPGSVSAATVENGPDSPIPSRNVAQKPRSLRRGAKRPSRKTDAPLTAAERAANYRARKRS